MNDDQAELLRRPEALELFAKLIADLTPGELVLAAVKQRSFGWSRSTNGGRPPPSRCCYSWAPTCQGSW